MPLFSPRQIVGFPMWRLISIKKHIALSMNFQANLFFFDLLKCYKNSEKTLTQ